MLLKTIDYFGDKTPIWVDLEKKRRKSSGDFLYLSFAVTELEIGPIEKNAKK